MNRAQQILAAAGVEDMETWEVIFAKYAEGNGVDPVSARNDVLLAIVIMADYGIVPAWQGSRKGLRDLHEWVRDNTPNALKQAHGDASVAALSLLRMARDTTSAMIPIVLSQWGHIIRVLESAGIPTGTAAPKEPTGLTPSRL